MNEREDALERTLLQLRTTIYILEMWAEGQIAKPENVDNATNEALEASGAALLMRKGKSDD